MKRSSIFIGLLTMIISCSHAPVNRNNQIIKISFATGGCMGHCPYMAIVIDSTLNYYFEGVEYCDSAYLGVFEGRVSKGFWDSLNLKFEQIDDMQIDSNHNDSEDSLRTELIIYTKTKRKHVIGTDFSNGFRKLQDWLMDTYKHVHLSKIFDTKIQNPPPPPQELINQLRITPAKLR